LQQFPLFAILDTEQLQLLAFNGETRRFRAGETLFNEGSPGSGAVIVVSGEIALERQYDDGMVEEATLVAGKMVGELSMITNIDRAISARALVPSEVFIISRPLFRRVLNEFPETAARIHQFLGNRLKNAMGDLTGVLPQFDENLDSNL
jgi:CRP-like cAMP-binding protein